MNRTEDSVFGTLNFDGNWEKTEELKFYTRTYQIKVIVETFEKMDILDTQREAYKLYEHNLSHYIEKVPEVLLEYYKSNYNEIAKYNKIPESVNYENVTKELVVKLIKMKSVYFNRKGEFGWLCDCSWDNENGISIILSGEKPFVEEYDYLI